MKMYDTDCDELAEMHFDADYFKKHFKIISTIGKTVEMKPNLYRKIESVLIVYSNTGDDLLRFSYGQYNFEFDKEEIRMTSSSLPPEYQVTIFECNASW